MTGASNNPSFGSGASAALDPKQAARRAVQHILHALLRLRSRLLNLERSIVRAVLAPHPDDETLGCGGLIATLAAAGNAPHVLFLTDGSASHRGHPRLDAAGVAALRAEEAATALGTLGVPRAMIHFLNAPDGRLSRLDAREQSRILGALAGRLGELNPSEVYHPFRHDGSSEHEAAFILLEKTLRSAVWQNAQTAARVLEYPLWSRWSPRFLARFALAGGRIWRLPIHAVRRRKREAAAAYRSQVEPTPPWLRAVLPEGFVDSFLGSDEYFLETPRPGRP